MTPAMSVVICTRNRATQLPRFLDQLDVDELAATRAQLVLVDNGSSDGTFDVLSAFAGRAGVACRVVRESRTGLSRARNRGIVESAGDLIVFLDDDVYPRPGYFREIRRLGRETTYGFFGGRVLLFDPAAARTSVSEGAEERVFDPHTVLRAGALHGCSLIIRRSVFERIGLFDPVLGAGSPIPSAEDYDILVRALAAGYHGAFVPSLVVLHDHGRRAGSPEATTVRAGYDYGRGAVLFGRTVKGDLRYLALWFRALRNGLPLACARREIVGGVRYLLRHRGYERLGPPATAQVAA